MVVSRHLRKSINHHISKTEWVWPSRMLSVIYWRRSSVDSWQHLRRSTCRGKIFPSAEFGTKFTVSKGSVVIWVTAISL